MTLRIVFACLLSLLGASAAGAAETNAFTLAKSMVSKLPGKRVDMGMKSPPGDSPSFIVGEFDDARSWSEWSRLFKGQNVTVDFATQKLLYVVPSGAQDWLSLRSSSFAGGPASLVYALDRVHKEIAREWTRGHVWTVDRALAAVQLDVLEPAGSQAVSLEPGKKAPDVDSGRGDAPGLVLVEKQAAAKLPGARVALDIKPAAVVVGEIKDAKSWNQWSKVFRGQTVQVDFAKQKLVYVVPVAAQDELKPVWATHTPELSIATFSYTTVTNDLAHADVAGCLWVVPRELPNVRIDLVRTHRQRIALAALGAR